MKRFILPILLLFHCLGFSQNDNENFDDLDWPDVLNNGWNDVTQISIPKTAPSPSVNLIDLSKSNKAIQLKHTVSTSCGMYKAISSVGDYSLTSDIRIDNWSNSSRPFFTDWAIALGFFNIVEGWDFNGAPQITFVAQPVSNNLVLYALRSDAKPNEFFNLEFPERLEKHVWYTFSITLENKTGKVTTKVIEKSSKKIIHEAITQIPNWNSEKSGNYQNYGFWDGEYNTDATSGNQVTIDNIKFKTSKH
ncbi:hypothetical protein [Winogradskyella sp. 3972H.M.0a.05]|uniref:hypothetical protein n=1 Tax=Winogradskyella sp. 3972H.M.0a.05 TaxID=2950277 RepID=UPI003394C823